MKKHIIIGVVLMITSLNNLVAQDSNKVSASVLKRFDESFQGASNVHWVSLAKKVSQVRFRYLGNSCIAYFDQEGSLITNGRRIKSIHDLPLTVQAGLLNQKTRMERKFGAFTISIIYEMVKDDLTKYIISMENNKAAVTLSVNTLGFALVEKKTIRNIEPKAPPKDVIARN